MIDGRRGRKPTTAAPSQASVPTGPSLGTRLASLGVSADAITAFGVLLAAATGVIVAYGYFIVGVALITIGGLMDTLDGHVAKASGTASPRGAFFDSVSDRVGDSFIFFGVAGYFVRTGDGAAALLPLGVLAISSVVSYERAKAESLGFRAQGGVMERAERLIFLGVSLFIAAFVAAALVPLLWALAALTTATAIGRFARVWRQASNPQPEAEERTAVAVAVRRAAWRSVRYGDRPARQRRESLPISSRLRSVLGTGPDTSTTRRERARLRRNAHVFVRRDDIDR